MVTANNIILPESSVSVNSLGILSDNLCEITRHNRRKKE
jgi:hypothetical protein